MRISDWSSDVCSSDLLELSATNSTYMAAVSWTYPQDALIALRTAEAERDRTAPVAAGIDFSALNFRYRIAGDRPEWRPVRVFDDGRQVFIEFPGDIASGVMPPLFVRSEEHTSELQSLMRISYAVFCLKKQQHIKR